MIGVTVIKWIGCWEVHVVMVTVLFVIEFQFEQIFHVDLCHIVHNVSGMVVKVVTPGH